MNQLPLYKQIQHHIKQQIISGELRPHDRVPSEQELMDQFRVSKITVKNALLGLADEGIVVRMQGKGTFVSDQSRLNEAITLSNKQSHPGNLIGLIVPAMTTRVEQHLLRHVEYFVKTNGCRLLVKITNESSAEESKAIGDLIDAGVSGLIIFPTEDEKYNASLLRLSLDHFPFVFIDRYLRNIGTYCVCSDNVGGAAMAVSHLLDKGHRKIALISPENTNTAIEDRTSGYEQACIERNVLLDKKLWCHVPLRILRAGQAIPYLVDFLTQNADVTAAFTLTAEISTLTYHATKQAGRSLTDLEMLSFDYPELPDVPYIKQNERKIAEHAVRLLIGQIEGDYAEEQIFVPVELIV